MRDPFEALRQPWDLQAPDPLFAAHLRARLARAVALPKGVTVSHLTLGAEPDVARQPPGSTPAPVSAAATPIVPYLIVADARRALDWYAAVMGAHRRGEPMVMADGRIGHAELALAGGALFLADEPSPGPSGHRDVAAPRPDQPATVTLTLTVADVDRVAEDAVEAGAVLERPPADYPYGRNAVIRDPFGHRWMISTEPGPAPAPAAGRPSDIVYVSLWVPDGERAADFYRDVLGWTYHPSPSRGRRQVAGQSLPHGLHGGHEHRTLFVCFGVDQLDPALARVRAAGGVAGEPHVEPHGTTAECSDDQGAPFALVEASSAEASPAGDAPRGPAHGQRQGDVAYLTMEVADSGRARVFYGSVLGWQFRPGSVDDGWQNDAVVPMTGMRGGADQATTVPMYRVDDIAAAVERVRARGGTATTPEAQPYGITSSCVDDQGTRFYLGQL